MAPGEQRGVDGSSTITSVSTLQPPAASGKHSAARGEDFHGDQSSHSYLLISEVENFNEKGLYTEMTINLNVFTTED